MGKTNGWKIAGGLAAAAGGLILRSSYEREQISVETVQIMTDKVNRDLKLVYLADLHSHEFGRDNARLLKAIHQVNPDMVLVGGDMMVCKGESSDKENPHRRMPGSSSEVPLSLLRRLTEHYPVYYGNGNHETRMKRERSVYGKSYDSYVRRLRAMGVVMLENRTELFRGDVAITGIDLEERYYRKFSTDQLTVQAVEALLGPAAEERFQIMLCHSPMFFKTCRNWGADLTLSGHFHGGTIRLPILGGVMTPQYQFFLPWCAGTFEESGKHMIVSRGLGTHSINIRINNKPQIVVVDIYRSGSI